MRLFFLSLVSRKNWKKSLVIVSGSYWACLVIALWKKQSVELEVIKDDVALGLFGLMFLIEYFFELTMYFGSGWVEPSAENKIFRALVAVIGGLLFLTSLSKLSTNYFN